ncbi:MAG: hypothetical protein LBU62_04455 [Bacteroidales bacterium]|jgi:hypothetical protein|nr:hypothetical protein [Bacteroidales bacterium]
MKTNIQKLKNYRLLLLVFCVGVGLLAACRKDDKKLNLQDVIVGNWEVTDMQLSAGVKISIYRMIPAENIPVFQFTKDHTFSVSDKSGISYITGAYQTNKTELTLNSVMSENATAIKMTAQVNNKDNITVSQQFNTDFLTLLQLDPQVQTSLMLLLNMAGAGKDATVIIELHRK